MGWSDIHMDLLFEMMKRLDFIDAIRSECVCNNWRTLQCRKYARKHQIPWLLFSSEDDDSRYFFSIKDQKLICEISLPDITNQHFVGSSNGYLISVDPNNANLVATNPLAGGSHLPLPQISTLPDVINVTRDSFGRITEFEICNLSSNTQRHRLENVRKFYYKKVILSSDAKTVVVIHGLGGPKCWLAFARLGDDSWTGLPNSSRTNFDDIIFHKGRLYSVNFMGTLAIFDIDRPFDPPFVSPRGPLEDEDCASRRYLVESPCREKLFLVYKNFDEDEDLPRTDYFNVYLLDESTYMWKQIKSLEETSLFLGFNYSLSFCTKEFPNIRKNCIYFTDDNKNSYLFRPEIAGDMGVFSLEDGSIVPLYQDSELDQRNWPPPIWFVHSNIV